MVLYIENMVKQIFIRIVFSLLIVFSVNANSDVQYWENWQTVGQAKLKWGFWTIYDSKLLTPSGLYEHIKEPLVLEITYNRTISSQELLDATVEQWQHLKFTQAQINSWVAQMQEVWPNVRSGDKLIYSLNKKGVFYYQPLGEKAIKFGELNDEILASAFVEIWLSSKTSYPDMRKALIGQGKK